MVNEWKPIETAPRGVRLLFYWQGMLGDEVELGVEYALGKLYNDGKLWIDKSFDNEKVWPTHWMPLPAPPTPN